MLESLGRVWEEESGRENKRGGREGERGRVGERDRGGERRWGSKGWGEKDGGGKVGGREVGRRGGLIGRRRDGGESEEILQNLGINNIIRLQTL